MLPLAATLAIFKAMLDSPSVAAKHKAQVAEAGDYLTKRLATMAALVDKSMPPVAAFFDTSPCGKGGRQRELGKTLLFDITCRLAWRVPLTKLVELNRDVCLYLATLLLAALAWVGETLIMPEGIWIMMMTREAFNNILLKEASCNYDNCGLVSR